MYKEGTLRPPTQAELESKYFTLEIILLGWYPECWHDTECRHGGDHDDVPRTLGSAITYNGSPRISDLVEICQIYGIPTSAAIVPDGYDGELALDWRDL